MANDVVARIRAIARRRRVPKSEEKAAYETGRVESNFTNPAGGDADSQGWRQERASLYKDPRNLDASINRFFDETAKVDHGQKSYEIAAEVQRPAAQYRGRYKGASAEAQRLLKGSGGGKGGGGGTPSTATTGGAKGAPDARRAALQAYVLAQGTADQPDSVLNLAQSLTAARNAPDVKTALRSRRSAPSAPAVPDSGKAPAHVRVRPGADRAGVSTNPDVIAFVKRVAARAGHPVSIGTGTNHSRMTVDGNVSDHWSGHAADVPATGARLIALGQAALIEAGMPEKDARKQTGGLYNVGGHQVIFNTQKGGDHTNHLHVSAR